jgi:alcohol dehydrogenase YqhD (iron-dependent ADH family)
VIPNFKTGTLTSHQETTSLVSETIISEEFNTGFEYTATGTNVKTDDFINPVSETTINGWTSLGERPKWSVIDPAKTFQFTETYRAPGLRNRTTVQRTTEITSVVDTVSSFSE